METADPITAERGNEIVGLDIFKPTSDKISPERVMGLLTKMHTDQPSGGVDMSYGSSDAHILRFWGTKSNTPPPLVLFVHGGSWKSGTYMDSLGSAKVEYLARKGYAFASVNYTLIPIIAVEDQVQEVANALAYLVKEADSLNFDPERVILMGHSSGAHVVSLLGTDSAYLERTGLGLHIIHGVVVLDGSNYNALAEIIDSPGPVAESLIFGLGTDPDRLREMSPTYNARGPNARAFLLLQVQRYGDIRQAIEFEAVLNAAGTPARLHVFEGESFEGHIAMLLRIGDVDYPATKVLSDWLDKYVSV